MLLRAKPETIEAHQWFPGLRVPGVIETTTKGRFCVLNSHGGSEDVCPGDWVFLETDGVHYCVMSDRVKRQRFEEV